MNTILDYEIEKEIYESANSIIYRGKRKADNQKVILKQLRKEFPSPEEIARFKREYEMTGSIEYEGVVKTFGFSKYQNTFLMAIEDFGGDSIANYLITQHFTIEQFLPLAIRISEILSHIHSKKIIHKDINPSNIVWNSKTGQVKIIDFGISSDLSHETASPRHINSLEGTLNYISPEQTGRMNRVIDYRTDLYSLGATFYHMLTGKIPFTGNDSIEIVHSHIARDPIPPHIISKEIPEILSNIIIRLMAKTAENRYRSAIGLVHDLKWCLDASTTLSTRSMSGVGLQIGANDISDRFEIPQKLYGREKEVETLLNAFARINDDSKEIVLVSGYSGMGKSSVVQEIYKPIIERKGIFIQGKFDQFKRNIPYSSIIQAFRGLVQQILTESKEDLLIRKKQILNVLGQNCSIIIDVIPEVELITGEQPHAPVLSMEESKNRFNLVFRNFVRIFTSGKSPLAIFFDDLQWADLPSLQLLELILTDTEIGNLFVIGAYRDNEVDPTHPLITTLRDIENKNTTVNTITLSPLKLEHVEQLISDTIHLPQSETGSLASLCFEKTQGNPFFLNQFLKILYKESLVVFDSNLLHWKWEIAEIKKRGVTDNVVDLMTNKIKKLSFHTQKVLRLGACIGNRFDLKTLAIVNEKSLTKTAFELYEALKEGLIIPLTETYNLVGQEIEGVGFESIVPEYKFSHDRVQQAAYLLISEEDRKKVHLSVGRLLLEKSGSQSREEDLFNIVNHLNLGIDFITDESEKIKLIELNLSVSKKAKLSAAYEPAYNYAKSAMSLLPEEVWKNDLKLAVKVYLEVGETAFLSGNFDSMENILDTLLENEIELVDKAKAYEIKMHSLTAMHNSLGTVKMSLQILKLLGIDIPENPGQEEIGKELGVTMEALSKFKINELLDLPEMKDNEKIAALRILEATFSPCFQTNPALFPILVFKMTQLSLIYGNAKNSPQAYACYGLILCGIVGDIDSGYQFGQLAIKLIDKLKAEEHKPNTMYLVTIFITHWKEPLKNTIEPYWKAYQLGLIVGDFEYAAWSAMFYNINSFFVGKDLLKITEETLKLKNIIQEIKQETTLKQILMFHQFLLNLIGDNEKPWILIGESYNEDKMHPLNLEAKDNSSLFLNYFYKVFICLLLDETQLGIENLEEVGKYLGAMPSTYFVPQFHFYESLLKLKLYPEILNEEKEAILNKVNENQTKMKTWSDHCSENYLHKFYLVEAEKARVLGKNWEAVEFYDKAVKLSKQNDFLQEEALANELFANFWLFQDKKEMGQILINNSYYLYSLWGAKIKTTLMEKKYGHLISKKGKSAKFNTLTRNSTISTINDDSGNLDFVSVLKASQTISGEIVVDELLKKMMSVVIENAGAETGLLLQEKNGEWNILAKGEANKEYMEKSGVNHLVPLSIIQYVARTKEPVVLDNASIEGNFISDPYIIGKEPKSILCSAILHQGTVTGILFLENNSIPGVFTKDRLEVLQVLTSQAAISLENASLYANLEEKVKERTIQLEEAHKKIVLLEKETTEKQLAGGFAHEMRNALVGPKLVIQHALGQDGNEPFESICLKNSRKLKEVYLIIKDLVSEDTLESCLKIMKEVFQNEEELENSLNIIYKSINKGLDITKIIMDYSKVGNEQTGNQSIDLNRVLFNLVAEFEKEISDSKIKIEKDFSESGIEVLGLISHFESVYKNILLNARDALLDESLNNKENKFIKIRTEVKDNQFISEISDSGIGISTQNLNKIYDAFFSTKPDTGMGLGLGVVKKIISLYKGDIEVKSEEGAGTSFIVKIPIT